MELRFAGEVWEWQGLEQFHFVTVPDDLADAIGDRIDLVLQFEVRAP